ncbi:MAG: hypothetical protein NVS2B9_08920 [Myxococcales bacterium]
MNISAQRIPGFSFLLPFAPVARRRRVLWVGLACLAMALVSRPGSALAHDDGEKDDGEWNDRGGDEGRNHDRSDEDRRRSDGRRGWNARDGWTEETRRGGEHGGQDGWRRFQDGRDEDGDDGDRWARRPVREGDVRVDVDFGAPDEEEFGRRAPALEDFRASLEPYGTWIDTPEYGPVWRPAADDEGFRPYYAGRWAWTRAGWYWVSDEPYGWAVYHYGRWAHVASLGWAWLPGRVWAPAWVSWRWGAGYAGWSPLGPRESVSDQASAYVLVPQPRFLDPVPHQAVPIVRAPRLFAHTRALPIASPGPGAGPVVRGVAQAVGHPVQPLPFAAGRPPPSLCRLQPTR